ncbi:MAG: hypothetical protein P4L46_14815 [Fimbriimonas sp.]|nr:hypothetical protein [Fimbriimonas sp.]
MENGLSDVMTGDEAGAFVAQWVDQNPIGFRALADRLGIDSDQAARLRRQSLGRLSMQRWLSEQHPTRKRSKRAPGRLLVSIAIPTIAIGVVVAILATQRPSHDTGGGYSPPVNHTRLIASGPFNHAVARPMSAGGTMGFGIQQAHSIGPKFGAFAAQNAAPEEGSTARPQLQNRAGIEHLQGTDLTKKVISTGVAVPDDLAVDLTTPVGKFFVQGPRRLNLDSAYALRAADLVRISRALLQEVLAAHAKASSLQASKLPLTATLRLKLGILDATGNFDWPTDKVDRLVESFLDSDDSLQSKLVHPFIDLIGNAGSKIFFKSRLIQSGQ